MKAVFDIYAKSALVVGVLGVAVGFAKLENHFQQIICLFLSAILAAVLVVGEKIADAIRDKKAR